MSEMRPVCDTDGRTVAWVEGDRLWATMPDHPAPSVTSGEITPGSHLAPGRAPGTFWAYTADAATLVGTGDGPPAGIERIELPAGTRFLAQSPARSRPLLACAGRTVHERSEDGRWRPLHALDGPPAHLAVQPRRRRILVMDDDGTVVTLNPNGEGDPGPAGAPNATATEAVPAGAVAAAFDDVLGVLWTVTAGPDPRAVAVRVDPWPPRPLYDVGLPAAVSAISVSPNGEWLAMVTPARRLLLYSVAAQRLFRPPAGGASVSGATCTHDSRIVTVHPGGSAEFVELPARPEARSDGDELDFDVLWTSKIYKAVGAAAGQNRRG